jgi:hypothetical protein
LAEDRKAQLVQLERLKALGEKAYDDMYEAHSPSDATACYSDAKERFYDAISLANKLGLTDEAEALSKRLAHIKVVFRSQFS